MDAAGAKATGNLKRQLAGLRRASIEMDPTRMLAGLQQQTKLAEDDHVVEEQVDQRVLLDDVRWQRQTQQQQADKDDAKNEAPEHVNEIETREGTHDDDEEEEEEVGNKDDDEEDSDC